MRYSLAGLLVGIAVIALACLALAKASSVTATIVFNVTFLILLFASCAAVSPGGAARTFAAAFALCGGAFFLVTFFNPRLAFDPFVTGDIVEWSYTAIHGFRRHEFLPRDGEFDPKTLVSMDGRTAAFDEIGGVWVTDSGRPIISFEDYERIAECLLAIFIGFCGGLLSRFLYTRPHGRVMVGGALR